MLAGLSGDRAMIQMGPGRCLGPATQSGAGDRARVEDVLSFCDCSHFRFSVVRKTFSENILSDLRGKTNWRESQVLTREQRVKIEAKLLRVFKNI